MGISARRSGPRREESGLTTLVNTPADDSDVDNYVFSAPETLVRYEAIASDASVQQQVRDLVTTDAGFDSSVTIVDISNER